MDTKFQLCIFVMLACCNGLNAMETLIEGKVAYFLPQEHKFRKIYSGGPLCGFELSCQAKKNLYTWISVDSFTKKGTSLGCPTSTKISMVPLGIGFKYFIPLWNGSLECCCPIECYLGAGLLGTYVKMHDRSPYVKQKTSKWGTTGIVKLGALFNSGPLFLDLFTNYFYCPLSFSNTKSHRRVYRNSMNFGGWVFGAGIGYRFGEECRF